MGSSCNVFGVFPGKKLVTPSLSGTILPGITRRSIIELAQSLGYSVEERKLAIDELLQAQEVFTTGTAVVVSPVGGVTYQGAKTEFCEGAVGPVAQELFSGLTGIQTETRP